MVFAFFVSYAQPTNLDFSSGSINGWTLQEGGNQDSYLKTIYNIQPSTEYTVFTGPLADINGVPISPTSPLGGNFIRFGQTGWGGSTYKLSQTFTVNPTSTSLAFAYAAVMDNGGHTCSEQNYFDITIKDALGNVIPANSNNQSILNGVSCSSGDPNYTTFSHFGYKNWTNLSYDLSAYSGSPVTVDVLVAGCSMNQAAHPGYAYFDASFCSNTTTPSNVTVNGNSYMLAQANSTINVCDSYPTIIWAPVGATTFLWSGGAINGLTTQSVSISQPGMYHLSCNKPFSCSNTTEVNFKVSTTPTLAITGPTNVACPGTPLGLTASGASTYTWSTLSGTSQGTGYNSIYNVYPQVASVYQVKGKDSYGCAASLNYTASVLPSPTVSVSGNTLSCAAGSSITLTVTGADTYSWSSGATTNTILVAPTANTTYSVRGTLLSSGCTQVKNHIVSIGSGLTITTTKNKICIGDSTVLTAAGATSYTWSNGVNTNSVVVQPTVTTTYTLSAQTNSCGLQQSVFTVTVNAAPTLTINATSPILCGSNTTQLSGAGALTYTWSNGYIGNNTNVTQSVTTTYSVIAADAIGCLSSSSITIPSFPASGLTVSISSPSVICSGQSATLTASGAPNYSWSTGATTNSIVVSPTVTTSYNVAGTNVNGCGQMAFASIKVFTTTPTLSFTSYSYTTCPGAYTGLAITSPTNYLFSINPVVSITNSGGYLDLLPSPTVTTVYTVSANNGCGVATKTIMITPKPTPTLTLTGLDTICASSIASFTVSGGDSYGWQYNMNGTWVSGGNSTTFSINPVNSFSLQVYGYLNGCLGPIINKNIVLLNNLQIATISNSICAGSSVNLTATGSSQYTWSTGEITSSITVTPSVTTTYSVVGTTTNSCVNTKSITVSVLPFLTPVVLSPSSFSICIGGSSTLNATGYSSYVWSNGATTNSIVVSPTVTTTYSVVATNTDNCVASNTVSLVVNPSPTVSVNSGSVCLGNYFVMNPSGAATYTFSSMTPSVTPSVNTTYTVIGKSAQGCLSSNTAISSVTVNPIPIITVNSGSICSGETFTMTPGGGSLYVYSGGSNLVSPTIPSSYTVTGSDMNGCISTAVSSVNIGGTVTPITVNSGTICSGSSFTMIPSGASTYTYSSGSAVVSPSVSTDYTVTATSGSGCLSSATAICSVIVNQTPTVSVNSGTICSGASFTMAPSGASTYTYSSGSAVVSPSVSTDYTVTATSGSGCLSSAAAICSVIVNQTPTVSVNSGTICSGASFTMIPSGATTYTYSSGSDVISPITSTVITVTGTDANGCEDNIGSFSTITVNASPVVVASVNSSVVCEGTSVVLNVNGADTYSWSTGATSSSVAITPTTTTFYTVTGVDLNNCSNTQTVSVVVDNTCQDVWPGDANSDGTADNLDVLELGLHYTQTGAPRASISNTWQAYFANNWAGTITNGKNLNHSDCNGDGTINDDDTLAIFTNYGLIHAFKPSNQMITIPELSIVPDQQNVIKGTWGSSSIYLGEVLVPVNNINGIAFTINFDNTLIEPNSIWIEYPVSFINAANQNLHFRKLDFGNNNLFTATTHTINNNVNGNGLVGILHYKILSSLATDEVLNISLIEGYKSEISGLITPLSVGTGSLMAIGGSVGLQELNGNLISVSPNPTNGSLTIHSKTELQKIEVVAITGQVLLSEVPTNVSHTLHLDNFANGIYFINLYQNNRIVKREKVVLNK